MKNKLFISLMVTSILFVFASCNRDPLPPPEPVINRISVADLRQMYKDGVSTVDTNIYIRGIITLTPELSNVPSFIAYMQDSTAGICLTVSGANTFAMNSEVKILCRGASFTDYNGLLQFGDISIADQTELITLSAKAPAPFTITLDELLSGKHQAEYVMVNNVQFKDAGTFSGTKILTDCTSQIEVYTRSDATFASVALPTGNGTLKGITSVYNDTQLLLRESSELDMKGNRCGIASVIYLMQDFTTLANGANVSALTGWKTFSEAGTKSWQGYIYSGNHFVRAVSFGSNESSVIIWMITPVLDLTRAEKPYVSFESADGYDNGATLELFVSTDYPGSATPWTSNWTKLSFTMPPVTASGYSLFTSSGQVDLSPFKGGPVYLAWVYKGADLTGTASDKTTTWEVDNILVGEK